MIYFLIYSNNTFIRISVARVDALKVCLEEKLEDLKSNDEVKIETERHNRNKR